MRPESEANSSLRTQMIISSVGGFALGSILMFGLNVYGVIDNEVLKIICDFAVPPIGGCLGAGGVGIIETFRA